ncbi:M10 family metallopeptidase C-terminal domain-containing protein, partial [Microvirga roseola]|uniref:M10 family metallopeptidase C-terminal domain-containing protein n=1 Tax=Microvirga roseola TaxID=2883126 RepID=UPI003898FA66
TIVGGQGSDWLIGGTGADLFRFDAAVNSGVNTIEEFAVGEDKIGLSLDVFQGLSLTMGEDAYGNAYVMGRWLSNATFKVGTSASTWEQRIVYDQATGSVYYDADGAGAQAQVLFAKVSAGTALSATSFLLI